MTTLERKLGSRVNGLISGRPGTQAQIIRQLP